MSYIEIRGNDALCGAVEVSGSKNAALPILFASLAVHGVCRIRNLPDIGDVRDALAILKSFGTGVHREDSEVTLDCRDLQYTEPPEALVGRLRASTYLLGACLARFGRAKIYTYGGCNFGGRPIDLHLAAFSALSASEYRGELTRKACKGGDIIFPKVSVGATANAMILAAASPYETRIFGGACEPHIGALREFLTAAGAQIESPIPGEYRIRGTELHNAEATVLPDRIEAGTYLLAGAMTGGSVAVKKCPAKLLVPLNEVLTASGVDIFQDGDGIRQSGKQLRPIRTAAKPYPGFPTDLHPPLAAFLSRAGGEIREEVFENRFGYLSSLAAFGLRFEVCENTLTVFPSELHAAEVEATDLRGGAAALLAALSAKGKSKIHAAERLLRGYENLVGKVRSLGGEITLKE